MTRQERRNRRINTTVIVVLVWATATGCSTPSNGSDHYEAGRQRVVALANDTLVAIPHTARFVPRLRLALSDTDRELCHKKFAGFAYSKTSARQPEITAFAELVAPANPRAVLTTIEQSWRNHKYEIDPAGLRDPSFPKIRAHTGDYSLVATGFTDTAGFGNKPRISVYVSAKCLND